MPKENTHLFFADMLLKRMDNQELFILLGERINFFYLGSVTPDTFYYSKHRRLQAISDYLHGVSGNPANDIILESLELAKRARNEEDLAFLFGYMSHCALDSVFHPIIYFLSDNYYDSKTAVYLHRHLETFLDRRVNNSFFLDELIAANIVTSLTFFKTVSDRFAITEGDILKSFSRQRKGHKLFKSKLAYYVILFLNEAGIMRNREELALFYYNLSRDHKAFPDECKYRDPITGERQFSTIDGLLESSLNMASEMIMRAYDYYNNRIALTQCIEILSGKSLETGKLSCSVSDSKYTSFRDPERHCK